MAPVKLHRPVLLVAAISSGQRTAVDWACHQLEQTYGQIELQSNDLPFDQTTYYAEEMGANLMKRLVAFGPLIDPAGLAHIKLHSNQLESELAGHSERVARPVNIDPGYVTEAKLILATTKDRDHRIYLADGIFAEVTLYYRQYRWRASHWTYPDYQTAEVGEFLNHCRELLRKKYKQPSNL